MANKRLTADEIKDSRQRKQWRDADLQDARAAVAKQAWDASVALAQKPKPRRNRKVTAESLTTEANVALAGRQYLELQGWMVHRLTADRHARGGNRKAHEREAKGVPDYICHCVGSLFYWEAKRTFGGVIRQSQMYWAAAHPEYQICYARSVEELKAWVEGF